MIVEVLLLLRISMTWVMVWLISLPIQAITDEDVFPTPLVVKLHTAIQNLQPDTVRELLKGKQPYEFNQVSDGCTALGFAIGLMPVKNEPSDDFSTLTEIIDILLAAGVAPDAYTRVGDDRGTPLMMAVLQPIMYGIAVKLMEKGANIYATLNENLASITPVTLAVTHHNGDMILYWRERAKGQTLIEQNKLEQHIQAGRILLWRSISSKVS